MADLIATLITGLVAGLRPDQPLGKRLLVVTGLLLIGGALLVLLVGGLLMVFR